MAETPAVEAAARAQDQRAASRENLGQTSSRSTVNLTPTASSRTIFGLMAFAVMFSLIGNEIQSFQSKPSPTKNPVSTGVKIIIGGFMGSIILIEISKAGEPGRKLAVGTAVVVVMAAVIVKGGPVWTAANNLFGSKPTTPLGGSSSPAGSTSPTSSTTTTTAHAA